MKGQKGKKAEDGLDEHLIVAGDGGEIIQNVVANALVQHQNAAAHQVNQWELWQQFKLAYNGPEKLLPVILELLCVGIVMQADQRAQDNLQNALMQDLIVLMSFLALSYTAKTQAKEYVPPKTAALFIMAEALVTSLLAGVVLLSFWHQSQVFGSEYLADNYVAHQSPEFLSEQNNGTFVALYPYATIFLAGIAFFKDFICESCQALIQHCKKKPLNITEASMEAGEANSALTEYAQQASQQYARLKQSFVEAVSTSAMTAAFYQGPKKAAEHYESIRPLIVYYNTLSNEAQNAFKQAYQSVEWSWVSDVFNNQLTNFYSGHSYSAGLALGVALREYKDFYYTSDAEAQQQLSTSLDIAIKVAVGAVGIDAVWTAVGRVTSGSHSPSAAITGFALGLTSGYFAKDLGKMLEQFVSHVDTLANKLCKSTGATPAIGDSVSHVNQDTVTLTENPMQKPVEELA